MKFDNNVVRLLQKDIIFPSVALKSNADFHPIIFLREKACIHRNISTKIQIRLSLFMMIGCA